MSANATPRTLAEWTSQLASVRLPVASECRQAIVHAQADPLHSTRDLSEILAGCPVLALRLLREANHEARNPSATLESALTRLGTARIDALLAQVPDQPAAALPLGLRQMLVISRHAAQQADGLFGHRLARLWQDIHWCSLLFLSPLWALACSHPELLRRWEQRVMADGEPAATVERELLGVPVREIALALAQRWQLPEWIIQGYRLLGRDNRLLVRALHIAREEDPLRQQQLLDAQPDLRRWVTQPANTILLANGLALAAHAAWTGHDSQRWQSLTGLYLQLPLDEIQQQVHQQAAESARLQPLDGVWHPAQALLWPTGDRHLKPTPKPAVMDQPGWREHCARLLARPSPFANVPQLANCAAQALQACDVPRLALLFADRSRQHLLCQQSVGLAGDAARLQLDIAASPLLQRLLQAPAQLRLKPDQQARLLGLLPEAVRHAFPGQELLVQSLARHGRVVMLLIVDAGARHFEEEQWQALCRTSRCIEAALGQFDQPRR